MVQRSQTHFTLPYQSHASIMVRNGAVLFGLGYIVFLTVELITIFEYEPGSPCYDPVRAASGILMIVFVVLQSSLIVFYPRLNLNINGVIDRYLIVGIWRIFSSKFNIVVQIWLYAPLGDKPEPVASCCG